MELHKLSGVFIDVGVEVGRDLFFFHGQSEGKFVSYQLERVPVDGLVQVSSTSHGRAVTTIIRSKT